MADSDCDSDEEQEVVEGEVEVEVEGQPGVASTDLDVVTPQKVQNPTETAAVLGLSATGKRRRPPSAKQMVAMEAGPAKKARANPKQGPSRQQKPAALDLLADAAEEASPADAAQPSRARRAGSGPRSRTQRAPPLPPGEPGAKAPPKNMRRRGRKGGRATATAPQPIAGEAEPGTGVAPQRRGRVAKGPANPPPQDLSERETAAVIAKAKKNVMEHPKSRHVRETLAALPIGPYTRKSLQMAVDRVPKQKEKLIRPHKMDAMLAKQRKRASHETKVQQAQQLHEGGYTWKQISEALGVKTPTLRSWKRKDWAPDLRCENGGHNKIYDSERVRAAVTKCCGIASKEKRSGRAVAAMLGVSHHTVHKAGADCALVGGWLKLPSQKSRMKPEHMKGRKKWCVWHLHHYWKRMSPKGEEESEAAYEKRVLKAHEHAGDDSGNDPPGTRWWVFGDGKLFTATEGGIGGIVATEEYLKAYLKLFEQPSPEHPLSQAVWAAVGFDFKSPIVFLKGTMSAEMFVEEALKALQPTWNAQRRLVLDHSSNQDAAKVDAFLAEHSMQRIEGPTWDTWSRPCRGFAVKFPEGNIIENVWGWMVDSKHLKGQEFPKNAAGAQKLRDAIQTAWDEVPQDRINKCILHYIPRLEHCVAMDGGPIPW